VLRAPDFHDRLAIVTQGSGYGVLGSVADLVIVSLIHLCVSQCVEVLLPHLAGIVVEAVEPVAGAVRLRARVRAGQAACPRCGADSTRVHGRYVRRLADAAIGGAGR
jgi:hypothetical protein